LVGKFLDRIEIVAKKKVTSKNGRYLISVLFTVIDIFLELFGRFESAHFLVYAGCVELFLIFVHKLDF
jgi:hypothetical protein